MEEWYTYRQIIEMFGITKQTLNNWRRNGTIVYKIINKRKFMYQLPISKIIHNNEIRKTI
jgi:predicted site-specific integrase-resolvase